MEVVIIALWNIWKQRNGKIFRNERSSFSGWRSSFLHDMSLLMYRIKRKHHEDLKAWIGNLY
jgi:hypothetical protein